MPTEVLSTTARQRPELAQIVWRQACRAVGQPDRDGVAALALLRAAQDDPSVMAHALALGYSDLRTRPGDTASWAGAELLAEAIEFLGVKPQVDDITPQWER